MCKDIANLYENFSYSFFGPMEMFFSDELNIHDEPYELKLSLSVVLVIIMLASVVGNLCTCAVVARKRSMRTPTNFYLLSLAVSDLLIALFIPIEIYMIWIPDFYPFGESGCLLHFFLFNGLSNSSVLIISAFTVERYLVVSKPFLYKKLSSPNRVFKIAIVIWIISWSISLPEAISSNVLVVKHYVLCYGIISNSIRILIAVQIIFFFLIPMATISVLYVLIAGQLKSREKRIRNSPVYAKQSREKVVRMLVAVAASFFFCWSPYFFTRAMLVFPYFLNDELLVWRVFTLICVVNSYLSTAINPLLYSLMSRKFRNAFKVFQRKRRRRHVTRDEFSLFGEQTDSSLRISAAGLESASSWYLSVRPASDGPVGRRARAARLLRLICYLSSFVLSTY